MKKTLLNVILLSVFFAVVCANPLLAAHKKIDPRPNRSARLYHAKDYASGKTKAGHVVPLPDALQTFAGYTGTTTLASHDGFFTVSNSFTKNMLADQYGAFINDPATIGASGQSGYIVVSAAGGLGTFKLTAIDIGEYDTGNSVPKTEFADIYVEGFLDGVSQGVSNIVQGTGNYVVSYGINLGGLVSKDIDSYKVYFTAKSGSNFTAFNLTTFTVGTAVATTTPTVTTTSPATAITSTSATLAGNISADGGAAITDAGIVYGSALNPTVTDNKLSAGSVGVGNISLSAIGLSASTLYHYRAYAINSKGTVYGADQTFTTAAAVVAPAIVAGDTPTYTIGGSAVAISPTFTLTSTTTIAGAVITIGTNHSTADIILMTAANGISGSFNSSTGKLTLSGTATAAQYQDLIRSITFSTTATSTSTRGISYVVTNTLSNSSNTAASTVTVTQPTISTTGTLSALNTTPGTASAATSFNVSGANMTAGILVTPPSGFEVSTTSGTAGFASTVTVGAAGTIGSTQVWIRLTNATTVAGSPYSGDVVLSSAGATNVNVATVSSTVALPVYALDKAGLTSANPAKGAYSLRLLSSAYTGPLARITIGSNYYDVYPDASTGKIFSLNSPISAAYTNYNDAPTAKTANLLSTVIGSSNATVAIWYDQSGSGTDATQPSTGNQPEVINGGTVDKRNGLPIMVYAGSQWLGLPTTFYRPDAPNAVVNAVYQNTTQVANQALWGTDNGGWDRFQLLTYVSGLSYGLSNGGSINYIPEINTTSQVIYSAIFNYGTPNGTFVAVNGVDGTPFTEGLGDATANIAIGSIGNGASGMVGNMSEFTLFFSALPTGTRHTMEANQQAYYVVPPSVIATSNTAGVTTLTTTQGTASAAATFNVSGTGMTAGILVTPPTGYEVSLTSGTTGFAATQTVGAAGDIASTQVWIRLTSATTVAGSPYSGNVVLSSANATNVNVATVSSTVTATTPTVTTTAVVTNTVTSISATLAGNISNDGGGTITDGGVVYGLSTDPTVADSKVSAGSTGTGAISVSVTSLTANTLYHFRAYAVNSAGPAYGIDRTFTTKAAVPTTQASNLTFAVASATTETINWTSGNGANRVVFVNVSTTGILNTGTPVVANGVAYTATGSVTGGSSVSGTVSGTWRCVYNGTGSTVTVTGLVAGRAYKVMVLEYNGTTTGISYNTSTSATNNPSGFYAKPANGTIALSAVGAGGFNITFSTSYLTATNYEYDISTTSDFSAIVTGYSAVSTTSNPVTVTGLNPTTLYYVRGRGVNSSGISANSGVQNIKTLGIPIPLDKLGLTVATPSIGAYSLRLLASTYSGPLVRIAIGSNFYDIYPDATANKTFSLTSPVSTAYANYNDVATGATGTLLNSVLGSNTANVAIWYDQGGNTLNGVQGNPGSQPEIINAGTIDLTNSIPTIKFGGSQYLTVTSTVFNNDLSGSVVYNATTANTSSGGAGQWYNMNGIFGSEQGGDVPDFGYGVYNGKFTAGNGSSDNSVPSGSTVANGQQTLSSWTRSNTSGAISLYNNLAADGSATLSVGARTSVASVGIGAAQPIGGTFFNGTISEMTLFPIVYNTAQKQTIENNQYGYYMGPATITATGPLAAVSTTYGTASATPTSFTVTASNIVNDITVTPPAGYELSTTLAGTYTSTLTLTPSAFAYSGTVYVRLAANATAGDHTGNITLATFGSPGTTIATVSSHVTAAVLTYVATQASKTVGSANPTLTGTVTGFVNGETIAATTGTAAWTTTVDNTTAPGSYAITGSGLAATNYTFVQDAGNTTKLLVNDFTTPTNQATAIVFSNITTGGTQIDWTVGSGTSRAVFISAGTTGAPTTTNNTHYAASTTFASGDAAGTGWYCVYNGTGSSVTVTGLNDATTYRVKVIEYNGISGYEKYSPAPGGTDNPKNVTTVTAIATVTSVSVPANGTYKIGDVLTFTANMSAAVTVNTAGGTPYIPLTIGSSTVQAEYSGGTGTAALVFTYAVKSGDLDIDGIAVGTAITLNGGVMNNTDVTLNNIAATSAINIDGVKPTLTTVQISSPTTGLAKVGDVVTLAFTPSETLSTTPAVTIAGHAATVVAAGPGYSATYTMASGDTEGVIPFSISFTDAAGNAGTAVTATTNASSVTFDKTAPTISIGSPSLALTNVGPVTYTVTYTGSNTVTLNNADISLNKTGTADASTISVSGNVVTLSGISGAGTLGINIAAGSAKDAAGNLAPASAASGTFAVKIAETITMDATASKTYGDADYDAAAVSTNNIVLITYASDDTNVATIVNGNVHIVGAGEANITASQHSDATHTAAPDVVQHLTVGTKALTITANNKTKVYGDVLINEVGSQAFTSSGLANGETIGQINVEYNTGKAATAAAGTYAAQVRPFMAIGGTFNSANYTITYAKGDIIVGTLPITVTAATQNKTYGDADPALTYNVTTGALVNGDTFAGALTRDAGEAVNTYAIKQGTLALSSNYVLTYSGANLTISKKALVATADNKTRVYGADNPTFNVIYTGFANGDDVTKLTTPATATTTATTTSPVNTYTITIGGATSANYAITYTNGTLAVTPAALVAKADNQTKVYGAANPALTITYSGFVAGDDVTKLTTPAIANTTATTTSAVGSYGITSSGAASGNYTITYTAGSLTVTPAALLATADNKTKVYGAVNPALTITYSGFVAGDDVTKLTTPATATTTATTTSAVGSYGITASGAASGNYNITYTAGSLAVTPAVLLATADNKTRVYGADNPTFNVIYTGFANGDDVTKLTTPATATTTATTTSPVNTYTITIGGATSANYAITYTNGTLAVTPAALVAKADNQTKVYGAANPALTITYSGFVAGDDVTKLTTPAIANTTATTTSAVGSYGITSSGAASGNYSITYTAGSLTVTPAALLATADNKTKVYGAANPALTVTYTGFITGDDVTKLTTPATATTTANAASAVGIYTISAGGATSGNYTISYAAGTLAVTPAALTIAADNKTKVYGAALPTLNPIYTGFVNGDDATKLTTLPTVSTTATAASPVNTYPISVSSAASGNYTISYTAGILTVTKAALTIAADNKSKAYGSANPTLTAIYTGFVNGDDATKLSTPASITTTATTTSAVGTYPITASNAVSNNYSIAYTAGTLTVTNATLTITAASQSKTYGAANPTLTLSYSGFINGDTAASLTMQPTINTTATAASGAGTYPITVSGAATPNYTLVYVPATLTVNKAVLNITADNKTRIFGIANPALTATYSGFVNGDTQSSLTTQATLATNATAESLPGNYAIIASGAASANYSFTYSSGTLTVSPITNAVMTNLTLSSGPLSPVFAAAITTYTAAVENGIDQVTLTPTTADATAVVTINGTKTSNGVPSFGIPLNVGDNTVTVVITAQDGVTKFTYTITIHRGIPPLTIEPTNVLSPNGDGKNDTWVIKDIKLYPHNKVTIYDRGGREIYSKTGYDDSWSGTLNGAPLAQGTYYYVIDLGDGFPQIKGFITIIKSRN